MLRMSVIPPSALVGLLQLLVPKVPLLHVFALMLSNCSPAEIIFVTWVSLMSTTAYEMVLTTELFAPQLFAVWVTACRTSRRSGMPVRRPPPPPHHGQYHAPG